MNSLSVKQILDIDSRYADVFYYLYYETPFRNKNSTTYNEEINSLIDKYFTKENVQYLARKYVYHPYSGAIYLVDTNQSVLLSIFLMKNGSKSPSYPHTSLLGFKIKDDKFEDILIEFIKLCYERSGRFISMSDMLYCTVESYFPVKAIDTLIKCICDRKNHTREYNIESEIVYSNYYNDIVRLFEDINNSKYFGDFTKIIHKYLSPDELKNIRKHYSYKKKLEDGNITTILRDCNLIFDLVKKAYSDTSLPMNSIEFLINNGIDINEIMSNGESIINYIINCGVNVEETYKKINALKSHGLLNRQIQ